MNLPVPTPSTFWRLVLIPANACTRVALQLCVCVCVSQVRQMPVSETQGGSQLMSCLRVLVSPHNANQTQRHDTHPLKSLPRLVYKTLWFDFFLG
jgi:hypothetical protein